MRWKDAHDILVVGGKVDSKTFLWSIHIVKHIYIHTSLQRRLEQHTSKC